MTARNSSCPCGSRKKYKKCCENANPRANHKKIVEIRPLDDNSLANALYKSGGVAVGRLKSFMCIK